jgi:hypothetical protein
VPFLNPHSSKKKQENTEMTRKFGLTLLAALALAGAGVFGSASPGLAQTAQNFSGMATDISAQKDEGNKGKAGRRDGGRRDGGQRNIGQRDGGRRDIGRRDGGQRNIGQRNIGQRDTGQRDFGRRDLGRRDVGERRVGQSGRGLRGVSIRGASRATISGRNYSVWRGRHRVRHGNRWRTFVGLGTLGAIAFGTAYYYPYAYIDAPAPFCEGLTEDGCHLQWQEVPTLEGPPVFQCVAYCPWQ